MIAMIGLLLVFPDIALWLLGSFTDAKSEEMN